MPGPVSLGRHGARRGVCVCQCRQSLRGLGKGPGPKHLANVIALVVEHSNPDLNYIFVNRKQSATDWYYSSRNSNPGIQIVYI